MRGSRDKERRTAVIRRFRIGSGRENGTEATNSAGGRCGLKREQAPGGRGSSVGDEADELPPQMEGRRFLGWIEYVGPSCMPLTCL